MKPICIYHGNCADGFGAAWVVRKALGEGNVDFHAGVYGEAPPDVTGRDVILVDFSYKRPVLLEMATKANGILIIDHHKTARDDLQGLDSYMAGAEVAGADYCFVRAVFDMEHSGAMLAWRYYFPNQVPPQLLVHIEDRDLFRFDLANTREIQANVFSHPYDFEVWDELMAMPVDKLIADGTAIWRKHMKDIKEYIAATAHRMVIAGHDVPVLNAPYFWSSEAGHIMAQGEPFAACYWDTGEKRIFSLRSAPDGKDVSEIAKKFGGGGHKHAAGFDVPSGTFIGN